MNDTTFQGDGKIAYVPVVVNAKPPKQTHADRIRSMSDEELAELIGDNIDCAICKSEIFTTDGCPRTDDKDCYATWLDWLRREVKEEKA